MKKGRAHVSMCWKPGTCETHPSSSLQAAAPTERHSVRRLLANRRPTDAILLQSCSVLGAGSRDLWKDRAAHVIENGIGCSGVGYCEKRLANTSCSPTWADRSCFSNTCEPSNSWSDGLGQALASCPQDTELLRYSFLRTRASTHHQSSLVRTETEKPHEK